MPGKNRSPRNRTLTLDETDEERLSPRILSLPQTAGSVIAVKGKKPDDTPLSVEDIENRIVNADLLHALASFPRRFADLIIIDPPYNLDKDFHGNAFHARSDADYAEYLESWLPEVIECAKSGASIYVCCDWKSSSAVCASLSRHATVRNRITWQREKGRGASRNWKNCSEDIWYATVGDDFYYDADAVRQRKRVIAPYRENGEPKDWEETPDGKFRLSGASNFWNDLTVPYWSMRENTDHPTQKPEKLAARLILASSKPGDIVFDPFAGSGTFSVAAEKLGRRFVAIEQNKTYCLWAAKRLESADTDRSIQGYRDGAFTERNEGNRG